MYCIISQELNYGNIQAITNFFNLTLTDQKHFHENKSPINTVIINTIFRFIGFGSCFETCATGKLCGDGAVGRISSLHCVVSDLSAPLG